MYFGKRKLKVCWQLEANDCGPACIQMLTGFHGKMYPLKTIKSLCNMTRLGISVRDVVHCLEVLGFEVASVVINIKEARRMPLPAIIYFKRGHFVVVESIKKNKGCLEYTIADPSYGRVKLVENDLVDKWMSGDRGVAVVAQPTEKFGNVKSESDEHAIHRLMFETAKSIFSDNKKSLLWIAFLTMLTVVANWAMPMLLKTTIDDGIMKRNIDVVWAMLGAQFVFFLGFMLTGNISNLLSTKTNIRINIKLTSDYFAKVINLPMKYFDIGLRSDFIQRLSDLGRIESFVTGSMMSIVFAFLNIVVFSCILLHYNLSVFIIFMAFSAISFVYNAHFMRKRKYIDYASFTVSSERQNTIYEMIMGMPEIKINNAQKARISAWRKLEDKMNELTIRSLFLNYYMSNGVGLIGRLRDISLTALCSVLVIEGDMTMGTMMMISFLLGQLAGPVGQLTGFAQSVQDAKLSYSRINEVRGKPDEVKDNDKELSAAPLCEGIRFEGVSFKYAGLSSPYVLKDITLDIPLGKVTAIVGASGSGKTTMLKLMLGFYYPDEGHIYAGGMKMDTMNIASWRARCGVVMQDGRIFSGTVAENIALADETPDPKQLDYAAEVAAIDERIKMLPMGYNTRIGETGVDLSGGEKQRLFIARAVYKSPEFIFFDEATSSLDAGTERRIMDNLRTFYNGRTVVIIAHRLSTVRNADNIVFMENGCVMEQGSHDELMARKGCYQKLVENQLEFA